MDTIRVSPVSNFQQRLLAFISFLLLSGFSKAQSPHPEFTWVWAKKGWEIHKVLPSSPPSKNKIHVPLLRLEGILLHEVLSDGSLHEQLLPLRARKQDKKSLYFEAEIPREHRFLFRCDRAIGGILSAPSEKPARERTAHPILSFSLRDEVGIRTKASRIAVRFRWIRGGPPPRIEQVFPSARGNLFPEKAFTAPYILLGDQRGSIALAPQVATLREKHRIPLVLSSESKGGTSLELGFALTRLLSGRVVEAPEKALPLREEDLEVHGRLHLFPGSPPEEALRPLLNTLWMEGQVQPGLDLLGESWRSRRDQETISLLRKLDEEVKTWESRNPRVQDLASPQGILMIAAHLLETLRQQNSRPHPLSTAQQKLAQQRIGDTLSLLRWAPRRSGLFRTHFLGDPKKAVSWLQPEAEPFSTGDCARVALMALSIREHLRGEQSLLVRDLCQKLARFLMDNQTPRGAIASFFRDDLSPIRNAFAEDAAGSLACGRFLLAFGQAEKNPKAIQAAASLMKSLESRHRNPPIPDPKLLLTAPKSFSSPLRARTALDALALSLGLAKTEGRAAFLTNARLWLLELSKLQLCAATPTLQDRSRGAFAQSNLSLEISQDLGEAPSILIDAAEALGEPTALSRARSAIRFHFGHKLLTPELLRDLQKIEQSHGSLILDQEGESWCATENYWVSFLPSFAEEGQRVEIRAGPAIRKNSPSSQWGSFMGKGSPQGDWQILGGKLTSSGGKTRIQIQARPLHLLSYDPPQEVDRRFDLPINAKVLDLAAPPTKAWLSFGPPIGPMGSLPLSIQMEGNRAILKTIIPKAFLPDSNNLLTQIHVVVKGQELLSPKGQGARTLLGDSFLFDFNEPGTLHRLGIKRRRVSLFHGMGMGLQLGPKEPLTIPIPIPPSALQVHIQIRIQGEVQVQAGKSWAQSFAMPEGLPFVDRAFTLFDREDWGKGHGLTLRFLGRDQRGRLLRLRYSHEGNGSPITLFQKRVAPPRKAPSQARALILPVSLGKGFAPTSEELALSFFGSGSGHSLRDWIQRISQSKLQFSGRVLPWHSVALKKGANLSHLLQAVLLLHQKSLSQPHPPDLIFIPLREGDTHPFGSAWFPPREVARIFPAIGAKAPAVFVFPLSQGSLSLGPPASLLLQYWSGLPSGAQGLASFGSRFPARRPAPQGRPTEPSGLSLFEAGFGRLYLAAPKSLPLVRLPPLAKGGFLLELPIPLPDRERVLLEARSPSLLLPPALAQGELLAMRDTRLAPKLLGQQEKTSSLSLIHSLPTSRRDPSGSSTAQGFEIHTQNGEVIWKIQPKVAEKDGTQVFALRFLGTDLRPKRFRKSLREPEETFFRAIPADDPQLPKKRGGILRLECPIPLNTEEQRLFLQGRGTGLVTMRIQIGGQQLFEGRLAPGPSQVLLSLPPHRSERGLKIELENLREGKHSFVLERARTFPLVESLFQARNVTPRDLFRSSFGSPFSDGRHYAPTLLFPKSRSGSASIPLPVSIPPEGGILRVMAATSWRDSAPPPPLLRILFRPTGGGERRILLPWSPLGKKGSKIPLLRIDLNPFRGLTGFFILERKGNKAPIHILECSIRRG